MPVVSTATFMRAAGYVKTCRAVDYLGNDGVNVFICDGAAAATKHHFRSVPHHGEQVILVYASLVVRQATLLDDHGVQLQLLQGFLNYLC